MSEQLMNRTAVGAPGQPDAPRFPKPSATPEELSAFSAQHLLPIPLVTLVTYLAMIQSDTWERLASLIDAAPHRRAIVHRWIVRMWEDAEAGVSLSIRDPDLRRACADVVRMHSEVADGREASSHSWRGARSALAKIQSGTPVERAFAAAIGASAWRLEDVPGAAADMFHPLVEAAFLEIDVELGWTSAMDDQLAVRGERMMAAGKAAVDALPASTTPDEARRIEGEAFDRGMAAFVQANPSELDTRGELRAQRWMAVHDAGHAMLVTEVEAAAGR